MPRRSFSRRQRRHPQPSLAAPPPLAQRRAAPRAVGGFALRGCAGPRSIGFAPRRCGGPRSIDFAPRRCGGPRSIDFAPRRCAGRRSIGGFALVDLLVGTAVGLLVVAGAASVVAAQAKEARAQQIDARLVQELRSTTDLVLRDLRRAGYWSAAASGVRVDDEAPLANPHGVEAPSGAASDAVRLSFARDAAPQASVDDSERFGFRLRNQAVEMQLGHGNWQALNDAQTLAVTSFRVEPSVDEVSLAAFCADDCPAGSTTCPPRQQVLRYTVTVAGRSATDPRTTRVATGTVRARNDRVVGRCGA